MTVIPTEKDVVDWYSKLERHPDMTHPWQLLCWCYRRLEEIERSLMENPYLTVRDLRLLMLEQNAILKELCKP